MKTIPILTLICCTVLAASCTTTPQSGRLPTTPTAPQAPVSAVDGEWRDKDGIISRFAGGRFETLSADSNTTLAIGTYVETGNLIEIELTSVLRRTQSRVNCALVAPYLMNCTPSQGAKFSLYKPSMAPVGFTLQDMPEQMASAQPSQMTPATTMSPNATMPPTTSTPSVNFSGAQTGSSF